MKVIHTTKSPAAIGPYSQATVRGGTLYTSMQIGIDPSTSTLVGGFEAQAEQVMHNLRNILEQAGLGFGRVLRSTVYLSDLANYEAFNEVYKRFFIDVLPAREVLEVSRLPLDAKVGVSVIASS